MYFAPLQFFFFKFSFIVLCENLVRFVVLKVHSSNSDVWPILMREETAENPPSQVGVD